MNEDKKFDENYIKWKTWHPSVFGSFSLKEAAYFNAEISRLNFSTTTSKDVLEIGFGNGSFMGFCRSRNWNVFGIEVNRNLVSTAQQNGFKAIHIDDLVKNDKMRFDLIVAFDVFEHLSYIQCVETIKKMRQMLVDGGIFLTRSPNGDSPLGMRYQNGDPTHLSFIGTGSIKYMASEAGFSDVRVLPQSNPVIGCGFFEGIIRFMQNILFLIVDTTIRILFHPKTHVYYCSKNLIGVFKK